MKIEKNSIVSDTLKLSDKVAKVYTGYGLYCPGCKGAVQDTVEMVALNNGIELEKLLKDLNNAV